MIKLIFKTGYELDFNHIGTHDTFTYHKQIGLKNLTTIHMKRTIFKLQSDDERGKIYIEDKTEDYDFKVRSMKKFNPMTYKMEERYAETDGQ
jgi:hypothetical protein